MITVSGELEMELRPLEWPQPSICLLAEMIDRTSSSLNFDPLFRLLRFGRLWKRYGEHALFETGVDLIGVNPIGYAEVTFERSEMPLAQIISLLLFLFVLLLLAADCQGAIRHLDLDILLIKPREFSSDLVGIVFLDNVNGRIYIEGQLAPPKWVGIKDRATEGKAPGASLELFEKAINLAAQALEWPPRLGQDPLVLTLLFALNW